MRGNIRGRIFRAIALVAVAIALTACAVIQAPDQVRVSVGAGEQRFEQAKAYASLYVPYAMMATIAYTDAEYLNRDLCPAFDRNPPRSESDELLRRWVRHLNGSKWHCLFGRIGPQTCPAQFPNCEPVDGLQLHVWRRMDRGCQEVVIAFRGTDPWEIGDWISNLRWMLSPRFDQYEQVKHHIAGIVRQAERSGCQRAMFLAVGHSLGGGLAQHAAYGDRRLRYVYSFDPSPVTGFFDFTRALREENSQGLGIDRVYEGGEILSLPRIIAAEIFPPSACDPRVRMVRFNTISLGSPFQAHSMQTLTLNMIAMPPKPGGPAPTPYAYREATTCGQQGSRGGGVY